MLPSGWRDRLVPLRNPNTRGATGWCLEVHDLAIAKVAGREKGWVDFDAGVWFGLVAPAGTPRPVIDKLNAALRTALASDDVKKRLAADGTEVTPSTPEEYVAFIDKDEIKWSKIVKASGAKGE